MTQTHSTLFFLIGRIDVLLRPFLRFADQWYAPWVTVVSYLLIVFGLKAIYFIPSHDKEASERAKRKWAGLTFVHNLIIFLETAWILYLFGGAMLRYVTQNGLGYWGLYCDPNHNLDAESDFRFFESLFYLNKYHELFDTVILVLRGKSPSFLALFHHTVMLLVTYYNRWPYLAPAMWLSVVLNLVVHVFMYAYFTLTSLGIRLAFVRIWLTRIQILQFWIILFHALPWPYYRYYYGCLGHWFSWLWVVAPVTFINLLFLQFYVGQYIKQKKSSNKTE